MLTNHVYFSRSKSSNSFFLSGSGRSMPLISAYDFTFDETFSSFSIAERTALSLSSFEDFF